WDPELAEGQLEVRHLGDQAGIEDRLELVGEQRRHLRGRLQPELVAGELHPARRVDVVAGPAAEEDVLGGALCLVDVVEIVRDEERDAGLRGEAKELLVEDLLLRHAVVLQLEEEVARTEDVPVFGRELAGRVPVLDLERPRDLAAETRRQPDEALAVAGEVRSEERRVGKEWRAGGWADGDGERW